MLATAAVLQREDVVMRPMGFASRDELLMRYRRLRQIGKQHNSAMLKYLGKDAIVSQARRLGLAQGKSLVLDSMDDLNLVFDLLIHTAQIDRPRAIDRYNRSVKLTPGSDEALVLQAMRHAQFSIITSIRRHAVAGLLVKDLCRGVERLLIDESLEATLPDGATLATRLYSLDGFTITAGVFVPLDRDMIEQVIADNPQFLRKSLKALIDNRRFAEALYRTAVVSGTMQQVAYQDTMVHSS